MAVMDSAGDSDSGGRLRHVLSEYRIVLYGVAAVLAVWTVGYLIDLAWGAYSDSTALAHTVSGLLGATAMVLAICGALIGVLWGGLFVSRRRGN